MKTNRNRALSKLISPTVMITLSILVLLVLILVACGPTTSQPEAQEPGTPEDVISFTADQTELKPGQCTILHWNVTAGFGVVLNEEPVDANGESEVCPDESSAFVLAVDMGDRLESREVLVTVGDAAQMGNAGDEGPIEWRDRPPVEPGEPAYQAGTWVSTGGPPGGLGYDIRMDPRDPDVMYVTDAWAGAFKSVDGGETWFPINNGITARAGGSGDAIPVFSLTIDPNNPDTIWAGTQFGGGAFRSDDGGNNWHELSNGLLEPSLSIRGFTIEPGNSDVVYLAGEVSSWDWNGEPLTGLGMDMTRGAVYKTTDGGQNWNRTWYGDNLARYVWIHPDNHNLVYVSTGIFDREAANSNAEIPDPGGVGILRSRDGGATWEVLGTDNGIREDELYFGSLFMHPEDPNILIAAAGNDPYATALGRQVGAIYLTEDGGDNWNRVLELTNASAVEICTSDPRVVYAGSINGIYRSDDGGHTWRELVGGLWGSDDVLAGFPIDMQCDPRDADRIFVNNYIGGNFLSDDGGETWRLASKGYTGALLRQLDVAQTDPRTVYVANRMGTFVSRDGGETWQGTAHGAGRVPEATVVAVSPYDAEYALSVLLDGGPFPKLTRDAGQTWRNIGDFWPQSEFPGASVTRVVFSPYDPNLVLATGGVLNCRVAPAACDDFPLGISRSTDGGRSWSPTDLTDTQVMDIHFVNEAVALAVAYPSTVYRSSDGGQTWEVIAQDIAAKMQGELYILAIAADAADPNLVYAGFAGGGVMVSEDGGVTWRPSSAGMPPETVVIDFEVDRFRRGLAYAASTNSGVFYTLDEGRTWKALNEGLTTRTAMDLALSADGSVLYLATEGGGVFRLGTP